MNVEHLFDAIGLADERFLEQSERVFRRTPGRVRLRRALIAAVIAAIVLCVAAAAAGYMGLDIIGLIRGGLEERGADMNEGQIQAQVDEGQWIHLDGDSVAVIVPGNPVRILYSADAGVTWRESTVDGSEGMYAFGEWRPDTPYYGGWIGSFGEDGMYLALTGPLALGSQPVSLFLSDDGGETWREIGDPFHQGAHRCAVTGAAFASEEIGFVCYRYYEDAGPDIWFTHDGGRIWEELAVEEPAQYLPYAGSWVFTPCSPEFSGVSGAIPVTAFEQNTGREETLYLCTTDGGRSWAWSRLPGTESGG